MKDWRWKNQYIGLIEQKRNRICTLNSPAEIEQTKAKLQSLRPAYDEIICELGSGSGGHLLGLAAKNPRTLYIGFEIRYKRAYRTIEKAETQGLTNLYMVQGDARATLELFGPNSIDGVYINFPDPWAKKRWNKHRIISQPFIGDLVTRIVKGGFFSHKTDHPEYFENTRTLLSDIADLTVEITSYNLHTLDIAAEMVKTEFESLFISKGLPVHYLLARKK